MIKEEITLEWKHDEYEKRFHLDKENWIEWNLMNIVLMLLHAQMLNAASSRAI